MRPAKLVLFVFALAARADAAVLFDDFNYKKPKDLAAHGWIVRTEIGFPGVIGATWGSESVSFVDDPQQKGNRLLRLNSVTDGTPSNTRQAQICHQRKYREGTYAARVRFSDKTVSGPGGDAVVQTFYMISPLKAPMDLGYSEIDFEYLPNGGWGRTGQTMFTTTWETFSPDPNWKQDNLSTNSPGSLDGWRTLVANVGSGKVRYFIDGQLFAEHNDRFYPESYMSIDFNLWFIRNGAVSSAEPRRYEQDVDWVFFSDNDELTPAEVEKEVGQMRRKAVRFKDSVKTRRLDSPCNF